MLQNSGRSLLIGISAWISFCLLIAGWLPNPGPEIHSLWMLSGLVGLVSCVGLAEVMKTDIKQQQDLIDQYIEAAMTDGLTRIANRQALDKALNDLFSNQQQAPMCLIMLDIDHFKQINDEHGHLGGDTVLKCLSTQAMKFFRGKGSVARYGGEEFAVALPNTKLKQAFSIAEDFRKLVKSSSCEFLEETLSITISAGVAEIKEQDTPESLIRRADLALYTAKKLGRDCIWLADSATGLMDSEECLTFGA